MSFFERAALRHLVYPPSERFVPTRLILINYWLYQRQVFYFASGNLFLTGDNGSGKSTALTAAITSIFDGDTSPSRMDPFGGGKRSVRYYLLGDREAGFEYEARRAYMALEFQNPDGGFMTVGLGLQASSGSRDLQKWGFAVSQRLEFENGISLVSSSNEPLSKRQLKEAFSGTDGRIAESVEEYAKLVRRTIYPKTSDEEFGKLLELMLTIRGAKLGREVRPSEIEKLLRQSLSRLDQSILEQLREGIEGMDRHQRRLELLEAQLGAASRIATAFFEAALARLSLVSAKHAAALANVARLSAEREQLQQQAQTLRASLEAQTTLEAEQSQEQNALELERDSLEAQLQNADGALRDAENKLEETRRDVKREQERLRTAKERLEKEAAQQQQLRLEQQQLSEQMSQLTATLQHLRWFETSASLEQRQTSLNAAQTAWTRFEADTERLSEREFNTRKASTEVAQSREKLEFDTADFESIMQQTALELATQAVTLFGTSQREYQLALETTLEPSDATALLELTATEQIAQLRLSNDTARDGLRQIGTAVEQTQTDLHALDNASEATPPLPADRAKAVAVLQQAGIPCEVLYRTLKPKTDNLAGLVSPDLAGLESGLLQSGVLTSLVVSIEHLANATQLLQQQQLEDLLLRVANTKGTSLSAYLEPEEGAPSRVAAWLQNESGFMLDGTWSNGALSGISQPSTVRFLGTAARETERQRQLAALRQRLSTLEAQQATAQQAFANTQTHLLEFEHGWNALRDARMERKQRLAAEKNRNASAARFEDRTRQEVVALEALAAAQKAASRATQALELVLQPLGLPLEQAALNSAIAELRAAQQTNSQLENTLERNQRLIGEIERLGEAFLERQNEIAELDGKRSELEARREQLSERVQEMRAQLENPDLKAWRERLNKVRTRLGELRGGLRDLTRSLAKTQGDLEVALARLPGTQVQLERAKDWQTQIQQQLEMAQNIHPRIGAALQPSQESLEGLERTAAQLEAALDKIFYDQKPKLETPETFLPVLDLHHPRFTLDGQTISPDDLTTYLATELDDAQRLLTEEEARVFHNELVFALAEKLDERLREAREFVKKIRATLADLRFHDEQLDLQLERTTTGGLADLIDGKVAPAFQAPTWLEQVGQTVRELVARLRNQANPEISFPQALEAALDYREWYGFTFYSIVAERRVEITDRKFQSRSGGERSAVLYTFMFAALGARFAAMGTTAPRLIGLDEAFAGMDPHNIAALYTIMSSLNLSLIATSPSDIYLSRSLDVASAYRLFRVSSTNGDGVSSLARLWNGSKAIDMGM